MAPLQLAGATLAAIATASACTRKNPIYCDVPSDCESGACDIPHHTCVEAMDGPNGDGPAPDSDMRSVVQTDQAADLVLGQVNFDTAAALACGQTSVEPRAVSESNGVLFVRDSQYRAVAWAPVPTSDNASGSFVVGQTTFSACVDAGFDSVHTGALGELSAASGKLVLSDASHNRVLLYTPAPSGSGDIADYVLGQATYTSQGAGNAANQLGDPTGVWTDGTRIVVADRGNNRVLIWTGFPNTHAAPANVVVGQPDFGMGAPPTTPSQSNLLGPSSVWSDGARLYVSDTGHNRVLIWNTFPTTNGSPADVVLGQSSFTTGASGLSATALYAPRGLVSNADALFVADSINDRVVVYSPIPTDNGAAATFVLGQPALDVGGNQPPPSATSLMSPFSVAVAADHLWIADFGHKRVLRFTLYPAP